MHDLLNRVTALALDAAADGKTPLRGLGLYACARTLDIRHVPFEAPCLILVLAGRKVLYTPAGPVTATAGETLAVPGPAGFDLRNEPDPRQGVYRALVVPFSTGHIDRLREIHGLAARSGPAAVVHYGARADLLDSVRHYLAAPERSRLIEHRLLELLLILAETDPRLLAYALAAPEWRARVQAVLAADLAGDWDIGRVCRRLAVGESTLRRHLAAEGTGFRRLLQEARLGAALYRLQQTALPVQRIALDCGYQSVSRFTANFRERFGLTPTELRAAMTESGQHGSVAG
jgi:AraC-like DNA-binding protein